MRLIMLVMLLCMGLSAPLQAGDRVYEASAELPMKQAYERVYKALEDRRLWVVFEADIGGNLLGFEKRWGEDYNRNRFEGIRSMVFCNPWYANQVSNLDPTLLSLCPLSLTLTHRQGRTTVLFLRPSWVAEGSPAQSVLRELEQEVVGAIKEALKPN